MSSPTGAFTIPKRKRRADAEPSPPRAQQGPAPPAPEDADNEGPPEADMDAGPAVESVDDEQQPEAAALKRSRDDDDAESQEKRTRRKPPKKAAAGDPERGPSPPAAAAEGGPAPWKTAYKTPRRTGSKRAAQRDRAKRHEDAATPEPPSEPKELSDKWHQCTAHALNVVKNLRDAFWFREAVDPTLDGCPDYLDVIGDPIHVGEIEKRFESEAYEGESGFATFSAELRRVFDNAVAYNFSPDHVVHIAARKCLEAVEASLAECRDALVACSGALSEAEALRMCAAALKGDSVEAAQPHRPQQTLGELRRRLEALDEAAEPQLARLWGWLRDAEMERSGVAPLKPRRAKVTLFVGGVAFAAPLTALMKPVAVAYEAPAYYDEEPERAAPHVVARVAKDASEGERIAAMLAALAQYMEQCGGDGDHVLRTFSATIETRKEGATAGTSDVYYFDSRGRRFRSRADVARSLGFKPSTGKAAKPSKATKTPQPTEAARQRAKRLEAKIEKALERGESKAQLLGCPAAMPAAVDEDDVGAPSAAASAHRRGPASKRGDLGADAVAALLSAWHFVFTFRRELGLGRPDDLLYDQDTCRRATKGRAKNGGDDDEWRDDEADAPAHEGAAAAAFDDALLQSGPTAFSDALAGSQTGGADEVQAFVSRVHVALVRMILEDAAATMAWWPDRVAALPAGARRSSTGRPGAKPSKATTRLRQMASRVRLDSETVLGASGDETDAEARVWMEALEEIRHLKTNSGNPIRDAVQRAHDATRNAHVRLYLVRCLAWWRGNAAGTTKHSALRVLDAYRRHRPTILSALMYPMPADAGEADAAVKDGDAVDDDDDDAAEGDDDENDYDSPLLGCRVSVRGGNAGLVVSASSMRCHVLSDDGSCAAAAVADVEVVDDDDDSRARFFAARALHAAEAPRPEAHEVLLAEISRRNLTDRAGWETLASAIAGRVAAHDANARDSAAKDPSTLASARPPCRDDAAERDQALAGLVDTPQGAIIVGAARNEGAPQPHALATAVDKLRCGAAYASLALSERAELAAALARAASSCNAVEQACDSRGESWKTVDREANEARREAKEALGLRREATFGAAARAELEARARDKADKLYADMVQRRHRGSSTRGLKPPAHQSAGDDDASRDDEAREEAHGDVVETMLAEHAGEDKVRRLAERLAENACIKGLGGDVAADVVVLTKAQLREKEAKLHASADIALRRALRGAPVPRAQLESAAACAAAEASSSADVVDADALADEPCTMSADEARQQLARQRRERDALPRARVAALADLASALGQATKDEARLRGALDAARNAGLMGNERSAVGAALGAKRWVLDAVKRAFVALRDCESAAAIEAAASRARRDATDSAPVRGEKLGTDRHGQTFYGLERSCTTNADRIWVLPPRAGGDWCVLETPDHVADAAARLDDHAVRESALRAEMLLSCT